MTTGKIVALVISIVVLVPVLVIVSLLAISNVMYTMGQKENEISTTAVQVTPTQPDAFLDDRYESGARELAIDGIAVEPRGFSSDRKILAIWRMPEAVGWVPSDNELQLYDVASGELMQTVNGVAACSRTTPEDTVYCTRHTFADGGVLAVKKRKLIEFDVMTGDIVNELELPAKGTQEVRYLGDSGGNAIVEVNSSDALGTLGTSFVYAISQSTGKYVWEFQIGETKKEISDGCLLVDAGARVACAVLGFTDTDVPRTVQAIDAASGEKVSESPTGSWQLFGENGWINLDSPVINVSPEPPGSSSESIYDYEGHGISYEFAEQLKEGMGRVNLVPAPGVIASEPIVTYPLESYMQGSILDTLVINAQGEPLLRSTDPLRASALDGAEMERISDGKKLFTGIPVGVTANGAAVLYTADLFDEDAILIDVETGETIIDVTPGSVNPKFHIKFGVIHYSLAETSGAVLLPGS
ncbi:hypothetical protein [Homoserinimonas sp. OAct 916]|uniref:hypothetical protein n=1 Tax=Homoserinimonas sp. OAct 916 TaxID=2211450 RepID=UPI000DBE89FF|nr:hypothetical protein [Homoserinimonas sp. OAct 916]